MTFRELEDLCRQPLFDLISQSRAVHLQHWRGEEVQGCGLLSIKTGGCGEDCAYCAQSAHYSSGLEREELVSLESIRSQLGGRSELQEPRFRSTSARRFAIKRLGLMGLSKNFNQNKLWIGKNSLSHLLRRLASSSCLDSSGTESSCAARIWKSLRFGDRKRTLAAIFRGSFSGTS